MNRHALIVIGRAFASSLIFALPMLLTMEMWAIGFYIEPLKLALLIVLMIPLLTGISRVVGFEETTSLGDDIVDALVALALAVVMSAAILTILGVIAWGMHPQEIIGKIALQAFPGSFGAVLASDQLASGEQNGDRQGRRSYFMALFVMGAGALFLGLNVAPTEEVVLLSYMMPPWSEVALVVLSLAVMHAFVYVLSFRGGPEPIPGATFLGLFVRYSVVGYAIALLLSLYLLWTFGRTDGAGLGAIVSACVVLAFPCAIGAAASRLIV